MQHSIKCEINNERNIGYYVHRGFMYIGYYVHWVFWHWVLWGWVFCLWVLCHWTGFELSWSFRMFNISSTFLTRQKSFKNPLQPVSSIFFIKFNFYQFYLKPRRVRFAKPLPIVFGIQGSVLSSLSLYRSPFWHFSNRNSVFWLACHTRQINEWIHAIIHSRLDEISTKIWHVRSP